MALKARTKLCEAKELHEMIDLEDRGPVFLTCHATGWVRARKAKDNGSDDPSHAVNKYPAAPGLLNEGFGY